MVQQIISTIVPVLVTAIAGVLVAAIKAVGDAGVQLINEKITAVKASTGAEQWNHWMELAKTVWNAVDEEFRITPTLEKTIVNKQALFAEKIQQAIPEITNDEIEQLRQAVAGEINKGKAAIMGQVKDEQGNGLAPAAADQAFTAATAPSVCPGEASANVPEPTPTAVSAAVQAGVSVQ